MATTRSQDPLVWIDCEVGGKHLHIESTDTLLLC